MKTTLFCITAFLCFASFSQTISLTYDFETAATFTDFDGGVGTIVANPDPVGINTSANVGQIVRNVGQVWAGTYLTAAANIDFSTNTFICFKYYTTAPVNTAFSFKMEGCGGGCSREIAGVTSVSGAWDEICYDFAGEPTSYDRFVFLFRLGTMGDGTANHTVFIDDIRQLNEAILPFTANSEYFCDTPGETVTFGVGTPCDWYADETGGSILTGGTATSTFTTPVLTAQEDYWLDCGGSTAVNKPVGPTCGTTAFGNGTTGKIFFTSNMSDGSFFNAVELNQHVPAASTGCNWTACATNLTQGVTSCVTRANAGADNFLETFNFQTLGTTGQLPMDNGDNIEVLFTSNTGHPCYTTIGTGCTYGSHVPFPSTVDQELTFTGSEHNGANAGNNFIGVNFWVSGNTPDPRTNVNAIVNCGAVDCLTPLNDTLCLTPPTSASLAVLDAGGTYNWYAAATGGSILSGGSNTATFTTPVIGTTTSYWVEEVGTTSSTYVTGPTVNGSTDPLSVARVQFTSLISGSLNSLTMFRKMVGGNNGNPCNYRILLWDWTEYNTPTPAAGVGIVDYFPMVTASTSDNVPHTVTFPTGTLIAGHNYEMRIEADILMGGGAGGNTACYTSAHFSGDGPTAVATSYPGLDFMNHGTWDGTPPGPDDGKWTGYDWNVTEDGVAGPCTGAARTEVIAVDETCILSADLLTLKAVKSSRGALLNWKASEYNDETSFEIRKSSDGKKFEKIDVVNNFINESQHSYEDVNFRNGKAYYEILQVDQDGSTIKSNVEQLELNSLNSFDVYPNPIANSFFISGNLENDEHLIITVVDAIGKEVLSYEQSFMKGAFTEEIDFNSFSSGLYLLKIKSATNINTIKIIKD